MNGYFRREEDVFDRPDFARRIEARLNAGVAPGRIAMDLERAQPGGGRAWLKQSQTAPAAQQMSMARAGVSNPPTKYASAPESANYCPPVPSPGLGKDELDRRVNESKGRADFHEIDPFGTSLDAGGEVLLKHMPGGRNDTKDPDSSSYVRGSAEFGNFLFGANAAATGKSLEWAHKWGRNAQVGQDLLNLQTPTWRDRPEDIDTITSGYKYYMNGCSRKRQ
jgi:hypothetical protein